MHFLQAILPLIPQQWASLVGGKTSRYGDSFLHDFRRQKIEKNFFNERIGDKSVVVIQNSDLFLQKSELVLRNSQLVSRKSELRRTISALASTRTALVHTRAHLVFVRVALDFLRVGIIFTRVHFLRPGGALWKFLTTQTTH